MLHPETMQDDSRNNDLSHGNQSHEGGSLYGENRGSVSSQSQLSVGAGKEPSGNSNFRVIIRELELMNACYDPVLHMLCTQVPEKLLGYRQTLDAYCYTISTPEDVKEIQLPEGHVAIPVIFAGRCAAFIWVEAKVKLGDDVCFTISHM